MNQLLSLTVLVAALASASRAEQAEKKPAAPLTAKQLDAVWTDFAQNDDDGSRQAFQGIQGLIAAPKLAVPFLKERLKPVAGPDVKKIEQCITDLDGKDFKMREKAAKELEAIGVFAGPALERKLTEQLPLEVQRRISGLLEKIDRQPLTAAELQAVRGIEALQGIGTAEAADVLQSLAKGADGSIVTVQARKALAGLKARAAAK
jgi:hypothetical protein